MRLWRKSASTVHPRHVHAGPALSHLLAHASSSPVFPGNTASTTLRAPFERAGRWTQLMLVINNLTPQTLLSPQMRWQSPSRRVRLS